MKVVYTTDEAREMVKDFTPNSEYGNALLSMINQAEMWRTRARARHAAMQRAYDEGCVDHLDACDDGGAFWHEALEDR